VNGFTLKWHPDATDQLADFWTQAADRQAITSASAQIVCLLERNPLGAGTPVAEGLYRIIVPPLAVYYSVEQAQRLVRVAAVGLVH